MSALIDFCQDLPIARFGAGEVLLGEGAATGRLYVLIEGAVEILRGDFQVNTVAESGAVFGEMSALLDLPHTATVRALTPCRVHVIEGGGDFLQAHKEFSYQLAKLLAQRLHSVTTYLVDLKQQFEAEAGHLSMVDDILESLVHEQSRAFAPGSDREPDY